MTSYSRIIGLLAIAASAVAALSAQRPAPVTAADMVLTNGKIITVDARDSIAQAVAILRGTIAAVGTSGEMQAHIGPKTDVIDLRGRTATPGLIDSHVHFSEADELYTIDLSTVSSMQEVLDRVRAQVGKSKPGEWIRGSGWDEGKLKERRYISAADLDAVAPNNPVWLRHTTGHYGVANSYALEIAEITSATKDPPAGTIDRSADGRPTGVMKEAATGLVTKFVPPLTREQEKNGVIKIIEDFNKEGMTGAKDPGIGTDEWDIYQELLREQRLNVRVFALWRGGRSAANIGPLLARLEELPRPPASLGDGLLMSGGVKLFMDGSGGARTAWMYGDWNKNFREKDAGNAGYPATPPDDYSRIVTDLHNAGIHISTHAIGDRAIDFVVDNYERVLKAKPAKGLRHGIIHANTPTDRAIQTMARLQREYDAGYPESQAPFLWWIGDNYAGNLGPERAPRLKPLHTYTRNNVKWAGGSDYSVTPFAARYGLWSSVVRKTLNGTYGATPFGTAESVDVKTALRSYTIWAAHQMFLDDRIGSIETGKAADIAVWDRDLYSIPADDLKNLRCEMTLLAGKVVHRMGRP